MLRPINWEHPHASHHIVSDLHDTGFCVLRNHGVDLAGLTALRDAWRKWFEECTVKESYRHDYTQAGWFGCHHAEKPTSGGGRRDDKEYFQFFLNAIDNAPRNLQGITREHFMEMSAFALDLAAAIEVDTPIDEVPRYMGLVDAIENSPNTMLRILHYPAMGESELLAVNDAGVEACRAAAHTDVNLFTLIPCNAEPGLQLKNPNGEWEFVPWHPSYLIVNVGDMLELMSDKFFVSAQHRVITPTESDGSRMSLPFFVHPKPEIVLDPSKGFTAGDFLAARLRALEVV